MNATSSDRTQRGTLNLRPNARERATPSCHVNNDGPCGDSYSPDKLTEIRRRTLSPARKVALESLEATDKLGSRMYEAVKSLASISAAIGSETSQRDVVYGAQSVLDIDRLARRADRRRAEVSLHLVSHDPSSAVFRAALSPMVPSFQLAPHLTARHRPHILPTEL